LDCRQSPEESAKARKQNTMKPKLTSPAPSSFLWPELRDRLDRRKMFYQLAEATDGSKFKEPFGGLYCKGGRPALPIRRMVAILLLKHLCDLSDERMVECWSSGPCAQFFCGERELLWGAPCEASEAEYSLARIAFERVGRTVFDTTVNSKLRILKEIRIDVAAEMWRQ
jgi:IS5 family transposase